MSNKRVELRDLLMELFPVIKHLETFLWEIEGGDQILNSVAPGPPNSYLVSVAQQLMATGLIEAGFFPALARKFPLKAGRIKAVAARFGVEISVEAAVTPTAPPRPAPKPAPSPAPRPAPSRSVRLLHLSDFHFSSKWAWQSRPILSRLVVSVAELVAQGLAPHKVVITGDIANWGLAAEYQQAQEWLTAQLLPAAGLTISDVWMVPGNHDVNRKAIKRAAKSLQAELLRSGSSHAVAEVLGDADEAAILLKRHADYLTFAAEFGLPGDVPWWSKHEQINGVMVHVAGLNSAWMSTDDSDHSRLLLSEWQLNRLLSGADSADLSIALMHHPWSYFAEWDRRVSQGEARRSCGVLLRGHLHEVEVEHRVSPFNQTLELAAGSCYAGSQHPNSYQLIELAPFAGEARIHLRTWNTGKRDWVIDYNGADSPTGMIALPLRPSPHQK